MFSQITAAADGSDPEASFTSPSMEVFNVSATPQVNSSNVSSTSPDSSTTVLILDVTTCIIICVGLTLTLVAIYALYSLVRDDHVAPIYVINLLISDLIQFCSMINQVARSQDYTVRLIETTFYSVGVMASVCFMVCVAAERYLVIACPLWYHFRRTIKTSLVVSVVVWAFSLLLTLLWSLVADPQVYVIILAIFHLLPIPLFIFALGGTLRALSASRVPSDEKRRIVGILVLVLLIYTLLFMPIVIWFLTERDSLTFTYTALMLLKLSPLADLLLYVFIKKGTSDKLLDAICCCRMDSNDTSRTDSNGINTEDSSAAPAQAQHKLVQSSAQTD